MSIQFSGGALVENFQTYRKYLNDYLQGKYLNLKYAAKNANLTVFEKRILKARYLNHLKKFEESLKILKSFKVTDSHFIEGERLFLLGCTLSYLNRFEEARDCYFLSFEHYFYCEHVYGCFNSIYNVSTCYSKLNLNQKEKIYLNHAKEFGRTSREKVFIWKGFYYLFYKNNQFHEAEKEIEKCFEHLDLISKKDQENLIVLLNELALSHEIQSPYLLTWLENSDIKKNYRSYDRYIFYKKTSEVIEKNSSLKLPPRALKPGSYYYLLWQYLKEVQDGNHEGAQSYKDEINRLFPEMINEDFTFKFNQGNFQIPFKFLNKKINPLSKEEVNFENFNISLPERKILDRLFASPIPVRKEMIMEEVFGLDYQIEDETHFYYLIRKLKNQNFKIKNSNNCYYIETINQKEEQFVL